MESTKRKQRKLPKLIPKFALKPKFDYKNEMAKHLIKFLQEYSNATEAYIICRTPTEYVLGANKNIKVISWQQLHTIFTS
jgi:hypothetical protein